MLLRILMVICIFYTSCSDKKGGFMTDTINAWGGISIEKHELSNGLKVILAHDPNVPVFAFYTYFNVGSRNEKKGKTGIAHFFEHLLFKESKNFKEGEFDRIMEAHGASTNASTWLDWTNYYEVLPSSDETTELVIRLEADRMANMILNDRQVNSEREVIKNERRYRVDNDVDGIMSEKLDSLAFDRHPYGQPIIGWMQDIEGLNLQDCIQFYETFYAPNNATIVISGNFSKKKTLDSIQKYYGDFKSSLITKEHIPSEPDQTKLKKETIYRDDIDADKILIAYHVPNYAHPDTLGLEILSEILFNGEGSRIYKQLIIDQEIVNSLGASLPHLKDPALFQISVSMRKNHLVETAVDRIGKEIKKIQSDGITQKELDRAKNRFEMDYYHGLESVSGKARVLGQYQIVANDFKFPIDLMKKYQSITKEDIQRVASVYLQEKNATWIIAKPKKKKA